MQTITNVMRRNLTGSRRFFSLLLVLTILLSMTAGALSAFADAALLAEEGDPNGITFYKMTSLDQLAKNGHYIVTYGIEDGTYAALCSSEEATSYYASHQSIAISGNTLRVSPEEDYVLTLNEVRDDGTYRFTDSKNYRLKLDTTHVFQENSPSNMTIAEGTVGDTWTIKGSRALIWNGAAFTPAGGGSAPGSDLVIWTDIEPEDVEDPGEEKEPVFHKMISKAELQPGARYIIIATEFTEDGACYALTVPESDDAYTNRNIIPTMLNYSDELPYEPEEGARYVFTLGEGGTDGTWYFKGSGASLKLNNSNGVFAAAGSPGSVTVSRSGDDWALATVNRSLRWSGGYFMVSNNSATPGSTVEIWTDAEAVSEDACPCVCGDACACEASCDCGDPDCECGEPDETEETDTFYKVTQAAELHVGSQYVITYTDGGYYYALRYADDEVTKFAGQEIVYQLKGDGTDIDELAVPASAAYLLTLSEGDSAGTWRFEDAAGNRLKLDSTHVFHNSSTGNILVTAGGSAGTWRLQNYTASSGTKGRSLTWSGNGFDVTGSNAATGGSFVIWTNYVLPACECECDLCKDGCACESGTPCGSEQCACGKVKEYEVTFKKSDDGDKVVTMISSASAPTYANIPQEAREIAKSLETKKEIFLGWFDSDGKEFGSYVITEDTTFMPVTMTLSEEKEEFHKMTNVNEVQKDEESKKDDQYIIVVTSEDGTVTTLGTPFSNGHIVDLLMTKGDADTEDESAWNVSLNAPSVMTMTSAELNADGTATVEMRVDNKNRLKLGTSSTLLTPMFNDGGGKIVLSVDSSGKWTIYNAASRYLRYNSERGFHVHYKTSSDCANDIKTFEIWTNADSDKTVQAAAQTPVERFVEYLPLEWDVWQTGRRLLIVYTDSENDKSYALVAGDESNKIEVDIPEITLADGKTTRTLVTNSGNAWSTGDWFQTGDAWTNNTLVQSYNKKDYYLTLGEELFGEGSSSITFVQGDGTYTVKTDDGYLGWNGEQFIVTEEGKAVNVRIFGQYINETTYTYGRLTDLSALQDTNPFMIVIPITQPDGSLQRYAIGSGSASADGVPGWLVPVDLNEDGTLQVTGSDYLMRFEHGRLNASTSTSWTFDYIRLPSLSRYWRPQDLANNGTPLSNKSYKVRFAYGNDGSSILLRGNATDSWLNLAWIENTGDSKLVLTGTAVEQEYATPVEIYTVLTKEDDLFTVQYYDANGEAGDKVYTQGEIPLERLPDLYLDQDKNVVSKDAKGAIWYTFLGWTTKYTLNENGEAAACSYVPYLDRDDSANLYGFKRVLDENGKVVWEGNAFLDDALKLGLIGTGNPEQPDPVDPANYSWVPNSGKTLSLYPIYAVRGFDNVVTATEGGKDVVGISDWKADQDGNHRYQDPVRERWLGSVNIEVYIDGSIWVDSSPMYFSYHNDNTVDLNIKFVWDPLVEAAVGDTKEEKLYSFMSHFDPENDFPKYDQVGHFIIDGVYASQGGSQDGLYYDLNWMTEHGGQLDNVEGGSTVKVYVTTKYDVKYYLEYTEECNRETEFIGYDAGPYTTTGTFDAFQENIKNGDYHVSKSDDLMKEPNGNKATFDGDDGKSLDRDKFYWFAYDLVSKHNLIDLLPSPKARVEAEGFVLISESWALRNQSDDTVGTPDFGGTYTITGGKYGTGNTGDAYKEGASAPAAESSYTYHLYAKADIKRGDLTVSKEVVGHYNGETFTFTVTLSDETINGEYGDMTFENGVATVTLANGESATATGLPAGLTYEVVETENENFSIQSTGETGEIKEEGSTAAFTNTRKTGDLTVSKEVVGHHNGESFTFTITLREDDGEVADITDTFGDMTFENGVATVILASGESATATGLPVGLTYEVVETETEYFSAASTGVTGKITEEGSTAAFTNTRKTGDLTVSKEVTGADADLEKKFTFTVTLSDETINGEYGDMTFENGVATITLANGESATATGLPTGVTYTVEEAADDEYTAASTGETGTIAEEGCTAAFTNTRKTGDLTVSKTVEGEDGDRNKKFTFTVTLSDKTINGKYGDMTFENGVATITLANGESATATGLPTGVTYTVEEAADDEYTAASTGETGTIAEEGCTAAFTNTRKTGDLTVSKTVEGEDGDRNKKFTFTVTLSDKTINGKYGDMTFENGVATVTLKHGESAKAKGLPTGVTYTVEEDADDEYTTESTGETGTIEEDVTAEAKFVNRKIPEPTPDPSPETGDSFPMLLMVLMAVCSVAIFVAVLPKRKRGRM